jgi:hypothetical protein
VIVVLTWTVLTAVALLGAAPEFEATALDGRAAAGRLVTLDAQQVVIETEQGPATITIESLAAIARREAPARLEQTAALWVELADESDIAATEYVVTEGVASIALTGGQKLSLPTRAIRWVRFTPPAPSGDILAKQWADIAQTSATGDLLVIRKDGALDYLEGIVRDLSATTCNFEIDGEVIAVNREKLEGLVYFHPADEEAEEAVARIHLRDGSRLTVASATLDDVQLTLSIGSGAKWSVPLEEVTRFDFSAGKIAYLSDLDPEKAEYVPLFGFRKELPVLEQYYSYQRDGGFENRPLALDGVTYRKGLALQSRTALSYRLPGKFRLFKAVVGIDSDVQATGDAVLSIKADGKPLWEGELRGGEPPQELELELGGARRLEVVVDYGREQDVGDRVNLCEARVTK